MGWFRLEAALLTSAIFLWALNSLLQTFVLNFDSPQTFQHKLHWVVFYINKLLDWFQYIATVLQSVRALAEHAGSRVFKSRLRQNRCKYHRSSEMAKLDGYFKTKTTSLALRKTVGVARYRILIGQWLWVSITGKYLHHFTGNSDDSTWVSTYCFNYHLISTFQN